jgi:hypothetical protein
MTRRSLRSLAHPVHDLGEVRVRLAPSAAAEES